MLFQAFDYKQLRPNDVVNALYPFPQGSFEVWHVDQALRWQGYANNIWITRTVQAENLQAVREKGAVRLRNRVVDGEQGRYRVVPLKEGIHAPYDVRRRKNLSD